MSSDFRGHPDPYYVKDPALMLRAALHFPNSKVAIDRLREIGRPPMPPQISLNVGEILEIILALGGHVKVVMPASMALIISRNWTSLLGPWIRYLVETFALACDDDGTATPETVKYQEQTIWIISHFLTLIEGSAKKAKQDDVRLKRLNVLTPYLQMLIGRTWYKGIEEFDHGWGVWSSLFMILAYETKGPENLPPLLSEIFPGHIKPDFILGRHLQRVAQHITTMNIVELSGLTSFMMVVNGVFASEWEPLNSEGVKRTFLKITIRVTSALLHKRRLLRNVEATDPEWINVHPVLALLEQFLVVNTHGYYGALEALEGGLLLSYFKSYPCFFQYGGHEHDTNSAQILQRVTHLLVYPAVLRRFSRLLKKIEKSSALEEELRRRSKLFWAVWGRAKAKALHLLDVYRELKSSYYTRLPCHYEVRYSFIQHPFHNANLPKRHWFAALDVRQLYIVGISARERIGEPGIERSAFYSGMALA
ncbi:hypothetical protein AAF712_010092, partial [Marasmius tenuissimus]